MMETTLLRLQVNNHPGVMSQICGLFETSCIWIKVNANDKLDQVTKQLAKLEDVLLVEERRDAGTQLHTIEQVMSQAS